VAAGANPFELGADMVKDGFVSFIKALGAEAFSAAGVNGSQSSMDSYVQLSTYTFDPFSFPKVKELNFLSGVIAFLIILLYLGAGAGWAILCRVSPDLAMSISEITDIDRDIAGKQYIQNIALGIFALLLGQVIIRLILTLNFVLSSLVTKYAVFSTLDVSSNYILYLFSGLVFLANVVFYVWRLIVICVVAAFSFVLGAMLVWGATRNIAISITKYFIAVTFLQLIIVAVITAGMITLDVIKSFDFSMIPFAANLEGYVLFVVLLISILVSLLICLGPIFRPAMKIVVRAVA
jgi:hypothetical protein